MEIIVIHSLAKLDDNANIAVSYRPLRIAREFSDMGFDVHVMSGGFRDRFRIFNEIRKKFDEGKKIRCIYHEINFRPMMLDGGNGKIGFNYFFDFYVFLWFHSKKIKMGVFYRDVLWRDLSLLKGWRLRLKSLFNLFHLFDLKFYNNFFDIIYLPTEEVKKFTPEINQEKIFILPPGMKIECKAKNKYKNSKTLIYVGAIFGQYEISKLFLSMKMVSDWKLILCVRKSEWKDFLKISNIEIPPNVYVVHAGSSELMDYYMESEAGLFFVKPTDYMKIAMPVKILEYLSFGLPVLSSDEVYASRIVRDNGVGWVIPYDEYDLAHFMRNFYKSPYDGINLRINNFCTANTWKSRAEKILKNLS